MSGPRILVVEDETLVARDLQATLTRLGYHVPEFVRSGEQALDVIGSGPPPDLVLMDIRLDGTLDGISTAERLKRRFDLPVVFLTAFLDDETIAEARRVSPHGYLIKPFDERELHSTVEVALSRHRSESQVRESAERFGATLRSMADGVIATDLAGRVTFLNPAAEELTGWGASDAIGRALGEVFRISHPSGEAAEPLPAVEGAEETAGGGRAGDGTGPPARPILLATRDDEIIAIEDNTAPLMNADGSLAGLVVVFRRRGASDEPVQPEADVSWSNLVAIVEGIGDPLIAVDAGWKLTYVNHQAAEYFGKPRDQLIGTDLWSEIPRSVQARSRADFYGALLHREVRTFEIHHESRKRWFEVHAYPFGDGLLVLFRDITARKSAEDQKARVEKLESLGLLARGFAHDFNNLLTVLLGNLSLASTRLDEGHPARGDLETARNATLQAQSLVQQLLTFAKGGAPIKKPVSLGDLVSETLRDHPRRPDLEYDLEIEAAPVAEVDPNQIRRLVVNLVRNAEQASTAGDRIVIRCTVEHPAESSAEDGDADAAPPPSSRFVVLQVEDEGHGIRKEDLDFIFEPYFSTRGAANATGLGLTVCESIARAHDGSITVDSEPEHGTLVTVRIPCEPAQRRAAETEPAAAPAAPRDTRPRRILLLEDEPLVRQLAVSHLESHAYVVEAVHDGSQAVDRFRAARDRGEPFDLLILDLTIPNGVGGARAMEQILEIDPDAEAVVSSGYSDDPAMARPADFGFTAVLPKPYEPRDLVDLVDRLVHRPAN